MAVYTVTTRLALADNTIALTVPVAKRRVLHGRSSLAVAQLALSPLTHA